MPKCQYTVQYQCPNESIEEITVEIKNCPQCGVTGISGADDAKKEARKVLKAHGRTKKCVIFQPAPHRCSLLTE